MEPMKPMAPMRPMEPMKPMEPMRPMEPMKPMSFGEPWWPANLGHPSSVGAQNGVRYAFFPDSRRLVIDRDGDRRIYDSADHRINGVSQQNSHGSHLSFSSQHGPVALDTLRVIDGATDQMPSQDSGRVSHREPAASRLEPVRASGERASVLAAAPASSESERVVFTEEGGAGRSIKIVATGEIDDHALDALEQFVDRCRKRRRAGA